MAHQSTIQAYALAAADAEALERRLRSAKNEMSRHYMQVLDHVVKTGAVTCEFNNTDELLTISVGEASPQGKHTLAHTFSRPNFTPSPTGEAHSG